MSTNTPRTATYKQIAFARSLLERAVKAGAIDGLTSETIDDFIAAQVAPLSVGDCITLIDRLKTLVGGIAVDTLAQGAERIITNRKGGPCGSCGRRVDPQTGHAALVGGTWVTYHLPGGCPTGGDEQVQDSGIDLTALPYPSSGSILVAAPNGDTRLKLKIDRPTSGKWAGWVFVRDAAVYGRSGSYGRQAPGRSYAGDAQDALRAIVADPAAALARYARLTGRCGACNTHLEDRTSIYNGIGPVCAENLGIPRITPPEGWDGWGDDEA